MTYLFGAIIVCILGYILGRLGRTYPLKGAYATVMVWFLKHEIRRHEKDIARAKLHIALIIKKHHVNYSEIGNLDAWIKV